MVFLRGKVDQFPLQAGPDHRGQGGELSAAGSQLYPGHGPAIASDSIMHQYGHCLYAEVLYVPLLH